MIKENYLRVVYDDVGCMNTLPGNYYKMLGKYGIKAVCFSRLKGQADNEFNNRSHRKIMVIDGRIITPHIPDKKIIFVMTRSYYKRLMDAGVKIYEYEPSFIHAKVYMSDDKYGIVGTVNLDYRSLCIRMEVPDENYAIMKNEIDKFIEEKDKYKFARLGLVLCFIGVPNKFKDKFFCSQFVAEMLVRAGAVKLKKRTSLYMPTHFINGIECLFSRKQLVYDVI